MPKASKANFGQQAFSLYAQNSLLTSREWPQN